MICPPEIYFETNRNKKETKPSSIPVALSQTNWVSFLISVLLSGFKGSCRPLICWLLWKYLCTAIKWHLNSGGRFGFFMHLTPAPSCPSPSPEGKHKQDFQLRSDSSSEPGSPSPDSYLPPLPSSSVKKQETKHKGREVFLGENLGPWYALVTPLK